ncbi:MAG: hypothetical protein WC004_03430 [Candidatus Absconditabacterales bacterium]
MYKYPNDIEIIGHCQIYGQYRENMYIPQAARTKTAFSMKNTFVPFVSMQLILLLWVQFNWDSGGIDDAQALTLGHITILAILAGLWYSFRHTTWMRPWVLWAVFAQTVPLLIWKGMGIMDWQTMVPLFVAGQVIGVLCARSRASVSNGTPPAAPANSEPPAITTAPTDEKTTDGGPSDNPITFTQNPLLRYVWQWRFFYWFLSCVRYNLVLS